MQRLYLFAAFVGAALPLIYLFRFLAAHGPDLRLLLGQLFQTDISAFFGVDVIISGLVLLVFIGREGRRLGVRGLWVCVLSTLLVGVSLGLPLFLFFRERRLARERAATL
ncbi:MAG TPA: DUF2834 domain-containing protein [Pyrinomonadaceae bacterium]|jgi:hypothetical protein|nr:DUF2834 domain-containing protein [Pyrinomonadaceae bacterium]